MHHGENQQVTEIDLVKPVQGNIIRYTCTFKGPFADWQAAFFMTLP